MRVKKTKSFSFIDVALDIFFDLFPPFLALGYIAYTLIYFTRVNFALFITLIIVFIVSILGGMLASLVNKYFLRNNGLNENF